MKRTRLLLGGALLAATLATASAAWLHGRSALWRIVASDCVTAAKAGRPSTCAAVSPEHADAAGYAVLKDRRGVLQYLLIPTRRISGIEDPALLAPGAGSYLAASWRERRWMDIANRAPVPREDVSLALNSAWSRSQDQLHVHISCVRPDLRARLRALDASFGDSWSTLPGGWQGHPYRVRRVVADTLDGIDWFHEIARANHDAMGRQAIAVVGSEFQGRPAFWLLQTHVDLSSGWLGGIEGDVQDHDCAVLGARPSH
jgi:CDP-diacylglycerol pyrophosphatase